MRGRNSGLLSYRRVRRCRSLLMACNLGRRVSLPLRPRLFDLGQPARLGRFREWSVRLWEGLLYAFQLVTPQTYGLPHLVDALCERVLEWDVVVLHALPGAKVVISLSIGLADEPVDLLGCQIRDVTTAA